MRNKFEDYLEKEREQITGAIKYGYHDASYIGLESYYDRTFTEYVY